jgi:hypothetical protein
VDFITPYPRTQVQQGNRRHILEIIKSTGPIQFAQPDIESRTIADKGGDALDSVIAALAVFRTLNRDRELSPMDRKPLIEGYVYA